MPRDSLMVRVECSEDCGCSEDRCQNREVQVKITVFNYLVDDYFEFPVAYHLNYLNHCNLSIFQKGRQFPLLVFRNVEKGWSLHSLNNYEEGSFVTDYIGKVSQRYEYFIRLAIFSLIKYFCFACKGMI